MSALAAENGSRPLRRPGLRPEHLLKERLEGVDVSRETLGGVYRQLKSFRGTSLADLAREAGISPEQALTALTAFEQVGLLRWTREPFGVQLVVPAPRTDLARSPLVRYLRDLAED